MVHENLTTALKQAKPEIKDKLHVMDNFLGEARIRELSQVPLLKTLTEVQMEHGDEDRFVSDLRDEKIATFINIGRFDYQKGHDRLIEAFTTVYQENPQTRLIIVAPHGPLREQTLALVNNSKAGKGIYILGRMGNPYSLLAASDCFVLSSHYEGLGLVVYEALAVGISVVTVNLKETIGYLQNDEAIVVENSQVGLVTGMKKYLQLEEPLNPFDFSRPLARSKGQFEGLLNDESLGMSQEREVEIII